ncbi:transporter substrate-binding domain-containing protein [Serratia quinivorans]|uniref:transporter substrate-binding domain-containing protein n=1 Tax=Serratia quinivorans TaxID=137545 RepID=UPI003F971D3E
MTPDEKEWLRSHQELRVGSYDGGLPPLEDRVKNQLTGFAPDVLNEVTSRLKLTVKVKEYQNRLDMMQALQRGEIDLVMNMSPTFSGAKYLRYSQPYGDNDLIIISARDNRHILDHSDLVKASVAVVAGSPEAALIPDIYPAIRLHEFANQTAAMISVEKGDSDVFIGNRYTIRYYIALNKSETFRTVGNAYLPLQTLRFAFPRDSQLLANAFDIAITDMGWREQQTLFEKWVAPYSARLLRSERINLSPDQITLLNQLPHLQVSNLESYPPFSFRNQHGEPSGLVEDYFDLIRRQLQLKTERVRVRSLNELMKMIKEGEIDMVPGLPPTEERMQFLAFSQPYARFPLMIATRKETSNIEGIESLGKARVALSEDAEPIPTLLRKNPELTLVHTDTAEQGLQLLADRQVDAYIGNLVVTDRIITEQYPDILKVAAPTGYYAELAVAVTKKYAYVIPLINQALANITTARKEQIRSAWFPITFHENADLLVIVRKILPAILAVGFIMALLIIAYWRLRKETHQRVRAQITLADQLSFQHALLETIPFPVLGKDHNDRYIAVNSAFEKLTGHAPAHMLGKTPEECGYIDAIVSLEREPENRAALSAEEGIHRSLRYADAKGELREGLFWLKPFFSTDGGLGGSVTVLVDVTDIRRSEERALVSEALLTDITESLPVTVFQVCLSVNGDMRFTYVAGAAEATFGLSAETMMADHESFHQRVNAEDLPMLQESLIRMQGTLAPFQCEFRMQVKNNSCWIRVNSGRGKRENNGDVLWGGYFEDITQSRHQERALFEAKTKAEAAARAKATFLATMSHEIRTPVHGILGWLELLERTRLDDEQNRMLATVQSSAQHLTQVIDDILDFSKLEAGQVSLENLAMDIRGFLSELMQTLSLQALKKNLTLHLYLDSQIAQKLMFDPVRLRQILMNFLSNSLKFTRAGHITLQLVLLSNQKSRQKLRFSVVDTGIGIPADMQQQLFQSFQQAEASTTRRFGGTGLGLAISKGLAQQMNGDLTMLSQPGEGTTLSLDVCFDVYAPSPALPGLLGTRATLWCDDTVISQNLREMLLALGITVTCISGTQSPALVIAGCDLLFIEEATLENLAIPATARENVIALSQKPRPDNAANLHILGVTPLSWERLKNLCATLLIKQKKHAVNVSAPTEVATADITLSREHALANGSLILVAEDHPISRELIKHQLQILGYCFDIVEDGQQALQAIENTNYGLAIIDCHMPYIDGLELSRLIRKKEAANKGPRLKIVALTAGVLEEQEDQCIAAGMDAYLTKPIDIKGLKEILTRLLTPKTVTTAAFTSTAPAPLLNLDMVSLNQRYGSEEKTRVVIGMMLGNLDHGLHQLVSSHSAVQQALIVRHLALDLAALDCHMLVELATELETRLHQGDINLADAVQDFKQIIEQLILQLHML